MAFDYKARQAALREIAGADAVAIVPGANLVYFTGLHAHLSERPIIAFFTEEGLSLVLPELEVGQVTARPDLEARVFPWSDKDGYLGALREAIFELGLRGKNIGVDGMTMRVTELFALLSVDNTLGVLQVENDLIRIRARKRPDEVAAMRRAVEISEAALDATLAWVEPGMTERAIARRLEAEMTERGGQGLAFNTIVQTGPNSAVPHGTLSDRALGADEFLLIDFGCLYEDYPADITRTFCLGTPSAEMVKMHDAVLRANEAARNLAGPGIRMGDVDRAARDIIKAAGYGEYFIHRTGHGLGLDEHEPIPQIAEGVNDLLEPGMVFTIEPGVYVPGVGGVRVEDNVLVTNTGIEVLTSFRRGLAAR